MAICLESHAEAGEFAVLVLRRPPLNRDFPFAGLSIIILPDEAARFKRKGVSQRGARPFGDSIVPMLLLPSSGAPVTMARDSSITGKTRTYHAIKDSCIWEVPPQGLDTER